VIDQLDRRMSDYSFGVNHYSTRWATGKILNSADPFIVCFGNVEHVTERDGIPIGTRGHNGHPYNVPWGFYALLKYIDTTWSQAEANCLGRQVPIVVTENGYAAQDEKSRSMKEIINDVERIDYFAGYLASLVRAKQEGTPMIGYMAWSLME
jgi:beta-glucosidase